MKIDFSKLLKNKNYCALVFRNYFRKKVIRSENPNLYLKHIKKAIKNLEFANFLLTEHNYSIRQKLPNQTFYDWCIIIYYYSIYHTALALLAKLGYKSQSHTATIAALTLFYYHKDNLLKQEDISFLIEKITFDKEEFDMVMKAKGMRERACYGADELFELGEAKRLQEQTADFVNRMRQLMEQ